VFRCVCVCVCCAWLYVRVNDKPFVLLRASSRDHRHSKLTLALAKLDVLYSFVTHDYYM